MFQNEQTNKSAPTLENLSSEFSDKVRLKTISLATETS